MKLVGEKIDSIDQTHIDLCCTSAPLQPTRLMRLLSSVSFPPLPQDGTWYVSTSHDMDNDDNAINARNFRIFHKASLQ